MLRVSTFVAIVFIAGCQDNSPPKPFDISKFECTEATIPLRMTKYEVQGFISPGSVITRCVSDYCFLDINEKPGARGKGVQILLDVGEDPMETDPIEENYTISDFKYRDSSGKVLGHADRVRVIAHLSVVEMAAGGVTCMFTKVRSIEKAVK